MKIMIIRHGDPDYEHDTLTETGWEEARALARKLAGEKLDYIYVSPLGRARDTASCTLQAIGRKEDAVFDWLREFPPVVKIVDDTQLLESYPDARQHEDGVWYQNVVWDNLPSYWTEYPCYFDKDGWRQGAIAVNSNMAPQYDNVITNFDSLLAKHGYERFHNYYRVTKPNTDTLVFFCHFGLECILLSRLLNVSPFVLLHGTAFAPTSVTVVNTEERQEGIACFRASRLGDISHLHAAGMEPSFSARFCEVYTDWKKRH